MYEIPSPEELREFMKKFDLTGADIAAMSGVIPRTARYWVASPESKGAKPIPWTAWALIQILTGEKSQEEIKGLVDLWKKEKTGIPLFERGKTEKK